MKRLFVWAIFGWLFALSTPVFASNVYVGVNLVLRAGPDIGYPRVTMVPAGTYLVIYGCLPDYTWCDVGYAGWRGWVAATYLQYYDSGTWVYLPTYAPRIGVPVVSFVLSVYWSNYYRYTSWYRDRARWERSPPEHRPPPVRAPSYRPRIPPPAHPPQSVTRRPGTLHPSSPANRPAPATKQRKPTKKGDKGGGHGHI